MKRLACLALLALAGCGADFSGGPGYVGGYGYVPPPAFPAIATPIGGGSYVVNQGPRHTVCNTVTGGVVICQ